MKTLEIWDNLQPWPPRKMPCAVKTKTKSRLLESSSLRLPDIHCHCDNVKCNCMPHHSWAEIHNSSSAHWDFLACWNRDDFVGQQYQPKRLNELSVLFVCHRPHQIGTLETTTSLNGGQDRLPILRLAVELI